MEAERLKTALEGVEDPRRTGRGHIRHKLEDIITIGLCPLICNGENFSDMKEFWKEREEWLGSKREEGSGIAIDGKTIREGGADCVIGLKGNQSAPLEDVSLYFEHLAGELPCLVTRMKDHGKIEKHACCLLTDLYWLPQRQVWEGLQTVGMAVLTVTRDGKNSTDTRFFLSSLKMWNVLLTQCENIGGLKTSCTGAWTSFLTRILPELGRICPHSI